MLLGGNGDGQPLPALGTPSFDDEPAVFGGHPDEKTVGSFPRNVAGLKCPFHLIGTPIFSGFLFFRSKEDF